MPKEMLGPLNFPIHRIVLGEFEVTAILDGSVCLGISPPFLLNESDAEIDEIANSANLSPEKLENNFVPVVINTGQKLILVDTGFGNLGRKMGAGLLKERLVQAGYQPTDIDIILLTHVHPDHIGGLYDDGQLSFPKAQIMMSHKEFYSWQSGEEIPEQRAENRDLFLKFLSPLEDQIRFLNDGDEIVNGVTAEAAYGHSVGHMMYRIQSNNHELLLWGDVANHYVFSVEHPDSLVGFDDIKDEAVITRNKVLNEAADSGVLVLGHHMPFPSLGYVQRIGESFKWVPATYQLRVQ
jgi:glyoxylase-like metal-dependent hydrolase (beta-lactamase superfamily II)